MTVLGSPYSSVDRHLNEYGPAVCRFSVSGQLTTRKLATQRSDKLQSDCAAQNSRSELQGFERDVSSLRIKQTVKLGAARVHHLGHLVLG